MAVVYQNHHIKYEAEWQEEWVVSLRRWMHASVSRLQQFKATDENYAELTNYVHAVVQIWNDMRMELDNDEDN